MIIFSTGDSHFNLDTRWDECIKSHQWFAKEVKEKKPDLVVHGGDLYHAESTPEERRCVANFIKSIADICPFVLARGNHDTPLDCHIMGRLAAKHPIVVEEKAGIKFVGDAAIAAVAWPDSIRNLSGKPMSIEETDALASESLQNLFRGIGAQWSEHAGPKIMDGHFMIDGSKTGAGQPLIGKEMHISLSDLALAKPGIVFASHIHKPQEFEYDGIPIILPGSLYRRDFGETEEKSYVVAEFDGSKLVDWHRVKSPCRQMILIEGEIIYDEEKKRIVFPSNLSFDDFDAENADIRIRYKVRPDHRDAGRRHVATLANTFYKKGAAYVKLDPEVIPETHARAPEIAQAKTLEDKLKAYWKATGAHLSDERQARLLGLLHQLKERETNEHQTR